MDENITGASEITTSSETETTETVSTETDTEVTSKIEETSGDNTAVQTDGETSAVGSVTEDVPFMMVKYNHEEKGLSQEEAITWAQKGMHYDALHSKLDYIAAQSDISVNTLVDNMMQSLEDAKRSELIERFGDDEATINDLMTLYRNQQKEKYDKVLADRKLAGEQQTESANARIAAEFTAMKAEHPELNDFSSLPAEVIKAAASGMPLEYAYLKYTHNENRKISAAQETAKRAAEVSTGSMSGEADTKSKAERQYLNALWNRN